MRTDAHAGQACPRRGLRCPLCGSAHIEPLNQWSAARVARRFGRIPHGLSLLHRSQAAGWLTAWAAVALASGLYVSMAGWSAWLWAGWLLLGLRQVVWGFDALTERSHARERSEQSACRAAASLGGHDCLTCEQCAVLVAPDGSVASATLGGLQRLAAAIGRASPADARQSRTGKPGESIEPDRMLAA